MFSCCPICLASSEDRIETPERTDDKQSSSTISTSTTSPAASRPSTDSSSQDPPAPGRKRALLCGVTSSGARLENRSPGLKGPVNDVEKIKEMLIKFGYNTDDQNCIRVLMTDQGDQEINGNEASATTPTKMNIEDSLKWLVEGAKSGDSLVFFFSGHGCSPQQPDRSNHVICNLVDCEGNVIPNSYINSTIVRPLEEGVTLYAIVDACHSGSILDLNFEYNQESNDWTDLSKAEKGTSGGLAICLSACRNDLTAPETNANSSGKVMGAMTYHLTDMVKSKHPANVTYEDILKKMHYLHKDWKTNERKPLVERSDLLLKFSESQKVEIPVLSSSHNFQVSSKKFLQAAPL